MDYNPLLLLFSRPSLESLKRPPPLKSLKIVSYPPPLPLKIPRVVYTHPKNFKRPTDYDEHIWRYGHFLNFMSIGQNEKGAVSRLRGRK